MLNAPVRVLTNPPLPIPVLQVFLVLHWPKSRGGGGGVGRWLTNESVLSHFMEHLPLVVVSARNLSCKVAEVTEDSDSSADDSEDSDSE